MSLDFFSLEAAIRTTDAPRFPTTPTRPGATAHRDAPPLKAEEDAVSADARPALTGRAVLKVEADMHAISRYRDYDLHSALHEGNTTQRGSNVPLSFSWFQIWNFAFQLFQIDRDAWKV